MLHLQLEKIGALGFFSSYARREILSSCHWRRSVFDCCSDSFRTAIQLIFLIPLIVQSRQTGCSRFLYLPHKEEKPSVQRILCLFKGSIDLACLHSLFLPLSSIRSLGSFNSLLRILLFKRVSAILLNFPCNLSVTRSISSSSAFQRASNSAVSLSNSCTFRQ